MDAEDVILYDLLFCIQRPHQREKEGRNMEFLTWLFTICGAATLARGVMAVIDVLEKE